MSAMESLNNAIASISMVSANAQASAGVKKAVNDIVQSWVAFWQSAERKYLPDAALSGKAERYLQWYARAYVLVPKAVRDKCPDPRRIDVSWAKLAEQSMSSAISDYRDAAKGAVKAGTDAGRAAVRGISAAAETITRDIERAGAAATQPIAAYGDAVRNTVLAVGAVAVVGYVLFARAKRA